MNGLLGNSLPPGLAGFVTQRQLAGQDDMRQMAQVQGLLGVQQAQMQQQEMARNNEFRGLLGQAIQSGDPARVQQVVAQFKPEAMLPNFLPKAPSWKESTIKNADGTTRKGFVDINSPNPESTFREMGVEPVKMENVSGAFVNPYKPPVNPIPSPTNPFNLIPDGNGGFKLTPNEPVQAFQLKKAATGASKQTTVVNPALDPFKNEESLRKEFTANPVVKNAAEMGGAFRLIDTAFKNPSPANDLAMATKYMKILDPTSVVRESELALAMGAVGILDKVYNYAQMVSSGQKLTPTQRKDFYDSAKAINDKFQEGAAAIAAQYKGIASQYGLKPENVTLENPAGGWSIKKVD